MAQVAAGQHRVVSMAQANRAGLARAAVAWRLRTGRWQQLRRGVYLTHSGDASWRARTMAAVLYAGDGAAVSSLAAAHLHGLVEREPSFVVVVVPTRRRVRSQPGLAVRRRDGLHLTRVDGIPVTTAEETVVDLAATVGLDDAIALAAKAVHRRLTTAQRLSELVAARRRHPWREALLLALGEVASGAESVLEVRFVRDVVRPHGLPVPLMQVTASSGARSVRRDFEYDEFALVVEVDGELGHAGEGMRRDRTRDRVTARSGRVTLRAGWVEVVHQSCELALDVALTLRSRGWRGEARGCSPQCPLATLDGNLGTP